MQITMSGSLVYVMAMTSLMALAVSAMDQTTKDYILQVHNEYRRKEGASNMAKLEWNTTLENEAISWAANCAFQHKGMGENLAWNSMTDTAETELIDKAMKAFYDERNRYSYGQYSCGPSMACHYTQLEWAKTTQLGCASQVCAPLRGAYSKAWFLVCRYNPPGNWNGEKPFLKGSACSACPSMATCEDGLCVGVTEEPEKCEDSADVADKCPGWADRGECERNPSYMRKSCKMSCNECRV